jgi:hypothetical protein
MMMNGPMMAGQTQQGGMNCRMMQGQSAVGWSGTASRAVVPVLSDF